MNGVSPDLDVLDASSEPEVITFDTVYGEHWQEAEKDCDCDCDCVDVD